MNDEQQDWNELLERLEDSGERMYGAMLGKTWVKMDHRRIDAAKMFRRNWDGCRDIWKASYRAMKERRAI